ncbi:CpsD/CapB family tyrosine-protein kinase [Paenibacillus pinistramenti]|uniref:CpsD/CapB family tyrosine-protein kinase n=1 Tax=Paenibacillus pinistramenti TaxID=1768003 RepID=UPI00110870D4|nr:CpsD/CapB family tyrosine-protein kinase [Paenibacillus pinistramenti]
MLRLNDSLILERNPASTAAESVRALRVFIRQHLRSSGEGTVIMLTSANEGEGKTLLAANLAVSFAQEGKRVCIIDANLRKPALHKAYGLKNGNGLADYLMGSVEAEAVIRPGSTPGLSIITGGAEPLNPSELLSNERMGQLLSKLKQQFDIVLLDSAGVLSYTDARVLASLTDGAVLVVRYGRTKREAVRKAKQYMDQAGVNVLGIAMNQVK